MDTPAAAAMNTDRVVTAFGGMSSRLSARQTGAITQAKYSRAFIPSNALEPRASTSASRYLPRSNTFVVYTMTVAKK